MNHRLARQLEKLSNAKRLVIKVGTSTLTYENGSMNIRRIETLVKVLSDLKNSGREIIFVTSGAIAIGAGYLGMRERPVDLSSKQAAAAVGQCELMYIYDKLFESYGHVTAQLLLTRDVLEQGPRKQNVVNTLTRLLEFNALPIINENDTVAVEEIEFGGKFGDNDKLSAMVAALANADALILLTDTDGLYSEDPRLNVHAQKVELVEYIDEGLLASAGGAGSARGTGGMATKVLAADIATSAGIPTVIMDGKNPNGIYDILDGNAVGTVFAANEKERQ